MLHVDRLNVSYGKVQVLWDVSVEVNEGEIVTVIGSNGAGKTTLLKTISGLIHPNSGNIIFRDKKIDKLPASRIVKEGIIHIPEGRGIFPNMTVSENLKLCAYRYTGSEGKEVFKWIFELFPVLRERQNQLAMTLSGGEQQMLTIAQGLLTKPTLLMLDEPSLGLAPTLAQRIFEVVKEINNKGITVLLVEQNVYHALSLADRGYVLENGRVVLEDEGKKLLENTKIKEAYLGL